MWQRRRVLVAAAAYRVLPSFYLVFSTNFKTKTCWVVAASRWLADCLMDSDGRRRPLMDRLEPPLECQRPLTFSLYLSLSLCISFHHPLHEKRKERSQKKNEKNLTVPEPDWGGLFHLLIGPAPYDVIDGLPKGPFGHLIGPAPNDVIDGLPKGPFAHWMGSAPYDVIDGLPKGPFAYLIGPALYDVIDDHSTKRPPPDRSTLDN